MQQIDYGQASSPRELPPLYLTQIPHRFAIVATLLTAAVIGLSVDYRQNAYLTVTTLCAAYASVAAALIGLILAYQRGQALRELIVVLTFSLVLAHLASWSMIDSRGPVDFFTRIAQVVL
jgi:hypothetical protein